MKQLVNFWTHSWREYSQKLQKHKQNKHLNYTKYLSEKYYDIMITLEMKNIFLNIKYEKYILKNIF